MTWRTIGPAVTTTAMVAAAWGGVAVEDQDPALSAGLWLLAGLLLGVLLVQVVVAWWIDVHRDDDGEQEQR